MRAVRLAYDFIGSDSDKFAPRGQVAASGFSGPFLNASSLFRQVGAGKTYPVTGGTYGWFGATGQVTVTRLNDQNEYSHMFELMYYKYKRN